MEGRDGLTVPPDRDAGTSRGVVGAFERGYVVQLKRIATGCSRITRLHPNIGFGLEPADHGHAHDKHGNAEMRHQHAVITAWLSSQSGPPLGRRVLTQTGHEVQEGGAGNPGRQQQAKPDHRCPMAEPEGGHNGAHHTHAKGPAQALGQIPDAGLSPTRHWADAHQKQGWCDQRNEDGIEVRWPDRQLAKAKRINDQRIQGAQQHGSRRDQQQHIVGQQHGLARNKFKLTAHADPWCTPGKQRQRAADHQRQKTQDENAARRIGGERVY